MDVSALLSVEIKCHKQDIPHFSNCNGNGQWDSNLYDLCKSECLINLINLASYEYTSFNPYFVKSEQHNRQCTREGEH